MNQEHLKKWLEYRELNVKPDRYKLESLVFSDNGISEEAHFKLNGYELSLLPLPKDFKNIYNIEGLMPAFFCRVISDYGVHRDGNNFDIHICLDKVLPLVGFKYRLPINFSKWEEYEGEWIECIGGGGVMHILAKHKSLPNNNIVKIVDAYEVLSENTNKRAKKVSKIRTQLKEAIELESVSKRYSFLSYYSILEIISDDLATNNNFSSKSIVAQEIAKFSLSTKGSQRTKIYFLLNALENNFDLEKCISLSEVRNDIAHGKQDVDHELFELCKKLSFWASEKFVFEIMKVV